MLRMLLKKSIFNVRMLCSVLICSGVLCASLLTDGRYQWILSGNNSMDILSLYTIPFAFSSFVIFAGIFPGLPYAYTYLEERNSGYLKFILTRMNRRKYAAQKIFFTGLSGGLSMAVPGIIVFVLMDMMSPNTSPANYPSIFEDLIWAPWMYIWGGRFVLFLKGILLFLFGIMWSELALTAALLVKNKYVAFVLPFFIFEILWITAGSSIFNPVYLIRSDFENNVPLYIPYLLDIVYIIVLVVVNIFLFRRRGNNEKL